MLSAESSPPIRKTGNWNWDGWDVAIYDNMHPCTLFDSFFGHIPVAGNWIYERHAGVCINHHQVFVSSVEVAMVTSDVMSPDPDPGQGRGRAKSWSDPRYLLNIEHFINITRLAFFVRLLVTCMDMTVYICNKAKFSHAAPKRPPGCKNLVICEVVWQRTAGLRVGMLAAFFPFHTIWGSKQQTCSIHQK